MKLEPRLWGMIWAVKRDSGKSTVFSQYFKVFEVVWDILAMPWDQLHDAGAAHLLFVVL